jgi:hypothetical protein
MLCPGGKSCTIILLIQDAKQNMWDGWYGDILRILLRVLPLRRRKFTMKVSDFLKWSALQNSHGLGFWCDEERSCRGISMGVVKIDEAVPDWDPYGVQYGHPNLTVMWNAIYGRMME